MVSSFRNESFELLSIWKWPFLTMWAFWATPGYLKVITSTSAGIEMNHLGSFKGKNVTIERRKISLTVLNDRNTF